MYFLSVNMTGFIFMIFYVAKSSKVVIDYVYHSYHYICNEVSCNYTKQDHVSFEKVLIQCDLFIILLLGSERNTVLAKQICCIQIKCIDYLEK